MSKEFTAERMRVLLADWIGVTTQPDVAEPSPVAPLASYALRHNALGGAEHEVYLKTANVSAFGWTRQNYDLRVYNMVIDFGAVGDGVTDNRTAINNAITQANAVGGAILYFPPGQYAVNKLNAGTTDLCPLSNVHNITFLGDGKASQIRIAGTQFSTQTVLFRIHNLSSGIRFFNIFIDSALATNVEATNQNHLIQPQGAVADGANTPASDVWIIGCYIGQAFGDQVRLAGDTNEIIFNIAIQYNVMDGRDSGGARHSRSIISFQRGVTKTFVQYNWMTGVLNGQLIDMEPSGTATVSEISIIGNQLDHNSQSTQAISLGGLPNGDCHHFIVAFNTLANGGNIEGLLFADSVIVGNAIVMNSTGNAEGLFFFQDGVVRTSIIANAGTLTDTTITRITMTMIGATIAPSEIYIADNVLRTASVGVAGNGAGFLDMANGAQMVCQGNIWTGQNGLANDTGLRYRTGTVGSVWDHIAFIGELAVFDAGGSTQISVLELSASNGNNLHNVYAGQNYLRKSDATNVVMEFLESGGALQVDYRYAGDNMMIGGLANFTFPPSNVGVTGLGVAGPGSRIAVSGATPVANINARAGSAGLNQAGGVATTLYVKETESGLNGGTSGWIGVGSEEITFACQDTTAATAARFLAAGSDLVNAQTTTVEIPVTRPGHVRNWRVHQIVGTGAGNITYTVRKNNTAQSGAVTIAFTTATGGPAGNFTVVAGDVLSVVITKTQAPATNPTFPVFTLDFVG